MLLRTWMRGESFIGSSRKAGTKEQTDKVREVRAMCR